MQCAWKIHAVGIAALLALVGAGCGSDDGSKAISSTEPPLVATTPTPTTTTPPSEVTDDTANAIVNKALTPVGIGCDEGVQVLSGTIEAFWDVGGDQIHVVSCLQSSTGNGAEFSFSLDGTQPKEPPDNVSGGSSGAYAFVGSNFALTIGGGATPADACEIKRLLPGEVTVIPTGGPRASC